MTENKIKILLITYYWPPSGGAGVQRCVKFTKYFPEFNIEPIVITVDENKAGYPIIDNTLLADVSPTARVHKTDTFEPFNLYKKLLKKKEIPYAGFANESNPSFMQKVSRFVRGNLFIPDARVGWNRYAYAAAEKILKQEKIDLILTSSPPHSTQLVGLKLKQKYGLPWIADLRDPWTDIYFYDKLYHTSLAKKIDARYEKKVLENADRVIVVSADIKRLFLKKSDKLVPEKIAVLPNGYDDLDFVEASRPPQDFFTITYTGTISDAYKAEPFIKAIKALILAKPDLPLKLRFVGKIAATLIHCIEKEGLQERAEFIGHVKHAESVAYLLSSSALFLAIPDVKNSEGILTGKLFEYLASRKPIICLGPPHGDAAQIIQECGAGQTFDRANEEGLQAYLQQLAAQWLLNYNLDRPSDAHCTYSRRGQTAALANMVKEMVR